VHGSRLGHCVTPTADGMFMVTYNQIKLTVTSIMVWTNVYNIYTFSIIFIFSSFGSNHANRSPGHGRVS
jgi:hypothetical protein